MYPFILALVLVFQLNGADQRQLALALEAQAQFERVAAAPAPALPQTQSCRQAQAAVLPLAPPEETPLIYFRKGYCGLETAGLTGQPGEYASAAADFEAAIRTWPPRAERMSRTAPPEPVPAGLRILAAISRLKASPSDEKAMDAARNVLGAAIDSRACPAGVMPADLCQKTLNVGRQWLGWVAFEQDDLYGAAKYFIPGSAWSHWVNGKAAFGQRRYKESSSEYQQAIAGWREEAAHPPASLVDRITPAPRMSRAFAESGGAQLVAGEPAAAIVSLNEAIRLEPGLARALYLRGRAKDAEGQTESALADYNLASRNAFASAEDLASGEAHLYRGVMLYRRGEFEKAEDEFSNALNFDIPADLRPDAEAWRHMAAVAGGNCGGSRERLERALETASPFFPKAEARTMAVNCTGPSTWLRPPAGDTR
jgi:hypothetical protein